MDDSDKYVSADTHDDLFGQYRNLIVKVDAYSRRIHDQFRTRIACRRGCSDCCRQQLKLLPVEFYFLRQRFALLPEDTQGIIKTAGDSTDCILLHRGACLLYSHRPIICRTHGLPLLVTENGRQRRDCCPKNFDLHSLADLPPSAVLHLERLNTILVLTNRIFAGRAGVEAGERIPLLRLHLLSPAGPSKKPGAGTRVKNDV